MHDARPLVLRFAVVSGGTIVEERLLAARTALTLGRSPRALIQAAEPDWPWSHRLLVPSRDGWSLRLGPGMRARVAEGGQPREVAGACVLRDRARGRISVGAMVLLVQVVRAPAVAPRPRLPPSMQRSPLAIGDRAFAAIAALSLALHAVLVVYLHHVDWPRQPDPEEIPDRFVSFAVRRLPTVAPPPQPAAAAAPAPAPAPTTTRAPTTARRTPAKPTASAPERRARLEQAVARTGLLGVLTARASGEGFVKDLLSAGSVDVDQEKALREVGSVSVATAEASLRGIHTGGPGRIATVGELRGDARIADAARVGPAAERAVARVNPDRPSLDAPTGATIDAGLIAREVKLRLSAVRACYERGLKRNPALAGKLVLRFTIAPSGAVSAVEVDDDGLGDPEVVACLKSIVARWRFPSPGAAAVEVAYPFVFQSSS